MLLYEKYILHLEIRVFQSLAMTYNLDLKPSQAFPFTIISISEFVFTVMYNDFTVITVMVMIDDFILNDYLTWSLNYLCLYLC